MKILCLAAAALLMPVAAFAQAGGTVLEQSSEYRFQIDLQVNQAALNKLLPAGWESAAAAQGPAKDCNLRLIFVDRVNIVGADNRVANPGQELVAYLEAPVRQSGAAAAGRMILSGIGRNDPGAASFAVLLPAARGSVRRSIATQGGATTVSEDWDFAAATGEHARLHVAYARLPANRAPGEVRFYDPADPNHSLMVRSEQETDITRNVTTTPPDRVREFSLDAGGGGWTALFDGSEKLLSWDSQPTYRRSIAQP